jgi:mitochondrial fission protein ELM1
MSALAGRPLPRIWLLIDGRPGHDHQVLGVADALGWPFTVKRIDYGRLARLPNLLLGRSISGLSATARAALAPPWPDLVIAAGRRTAPLARWLKQHKAGMLAVQLMWPGSARDLDLIAVPEHDRVADRPGMVRTLGTPGRVTPARLAAAAARLAPRVVQLPRPHIACLVGGARRGMSFTPNDAAELARRASRLAHARGGSLLVTSSRRTGADCEQSLARSIEAPHLLHRFAGDNNDLYLGMLGSADAVVVTADSASMCSEACATGRPVFLDGAQKAGLGKLTRLHRRLEQLGYLRPLGAPWPTAVPPPLEPASTVAAAIRSLLPKADSGMLEPVSAAS